MAKVNPSTRTKEDFFNLVWQVIRLIPKGRVTSYGAIAKFLGTGSSARTVGWAMNASHHATPAVPAHRVVNRLGMLSGKHHFSTPEAMENALKREGIEVKDDKVVDFAKLFWDPGKELDW
ncbi:MAG TPA: MGMT family protein [Chitinophagales bacterium]|nr:MGMT family protein [Chitinophagales bacterium]